ncbi:OmpA family protein [Donghicola sp. C2-DW-16]|uniref:OmpA family protein n=1 Tax=Donghicola mangrovi TaxID=2729614 RepID=A0ABX2PFX2_9RHOB|nr:OmpA family protein [Donghicola mangrovi]NVO28393.1 OmpA family protein [Donghicola mangrovi]
MQCRFKTKAALAGVILLSACASQDPVYRSFYDEAGALSDPRNHFGAATGNNIALMTGEKQYTYELASRFAAEVLTTVNFGFNSAELDEGARDTLREQARWINQFPEVRFRVYGHTDAVGSVSYNKSLGLRRANAVVAYLSQLGVSRSRLEAMVSYGETQPLIVTEGRERRNRRTVTEVLGFVQNHPTVMDGKYAQIVYREYVNSAVPASTLSGITGQEFKTEQ